MANEEDIGRVIHKTWRVVKKLGQGGMGTVWEVRHKDNRKFRSAVKEIKAELSQNQEVARRFLREFRLMAEFVGVEHIVRVTDFDRDEGFVFMTLVEGPSLKQIIDEGPVDYEQVLCFGRQIATALMHVHERGIVHRDIKPPNVLIDQKEQKAYLTDFGIAKKLDLAEGDETIDGTSTFDGTVDIQYMGTPRYSSPEQLRIEYPPHPLWDIYSMGVTLYEAYSGLRYLPQFNRYPDFRKNVADNPQFEITLPYPKPPPASFAAIVRECVERDPAKRLASAAALVARLRECEEELRVKGRAFLFPTPAPQVVFDEDETRRDDSVAERRETRQALREDIQQRFSQLDEIEGTLVAVGLNLPTGPAADTLNHALHEISIIEDGGQYREALGRLDALDEQVKAAQARAEAAARAGLARRLEELDAARRDLERAAGPWLEGEPRAAVDAGLATASAALADERWKAAGEALVGMPERLRVARETARAAAQTAVAAIVAEVEGQLASLQQLDAGAVPRGFDLEALRAQLAARLDAGELDAAAQQAGTARAVVVAALDRTRTRTAEQLSAARAALERRLAALDPAAANAAAPDALAELQRARTAAAAAEAAGDFPAALTAIAEAERIAGAAAARIAAAQAAEREGLAAALRAQLARTANDPAPVVGDARAAAQAVLEQPPAVHAEAVAALESAAARLAEAQTELPAFGAAEQRRTAARAARAAAVDLALPGAERRHAEGIFAAAEQHFEQRAWGDAAARYTAAQELWQALVTAALAQSQQEQCDAQRAALQEELETVAALEVERAALALPADDTPPVAALRAALEPVDAQQHGGAFAEALAGLSALRDQASRAQAAHAAALQAALAAALAKLAERREQLAQRAGTLLDPARRTALEQAAAAIETAIREGAWGAARGALADAEAALERSESELLRAVAGAVQEHLDTVESGLRALTESGAGGPQGLELTALRARTEALLAAGQLAAAQDAAAAAVAAIAAARAARERELAEQAGAARVALEAVVRGLDLPGLRALARTDVERGERLQRDGAAAETTRDFGAAATAYAAAAAAFNAAGAALDEQQRKETAALAAAVRERLAQAEPLPAALAETSRQAARTALERAAGPDRRAAHGALQDARDALDGAIADAPLFGEVAAARDAAGQAQAQLAALPVTVEEQERALGALRAGTAAFERAGWVEARDHFGAARQAFDELARVGEKRLQAQRELAAQRAAAQRELQTIAERARAEPPEVVGAALRAVDALLGEAAPDVDAMRAAGAALARALDEVPAYTAALERRTIAEALQAKVAKRKLKRQRLQAPRARLRTATAALAQRDWASAAAEFEAAHGALSELEQLPDDPTPRWPIAVVLLLLVVGGAVVWQYIPKPPPAPAVVEIASAVPSGPVSVEAGAAQKFTIELANSAGKKPHIEWSLDGQTVGAAAGKTVWSYQPGADAAGAKHTLSVRVDGGAADRQTQTWTVSVAAIPAPPPAALPPAAPPAALPAVTIADAQPSAPDVSLAKGASQSFAITLKDVPAGATPDVEWQVAGKSVPSASGKTQWSYTPDGSLAATQPYDVTVTVDGGRSDGQTHSWQVRATGNRPPELVKVLPSQSQEVKKDIGQTASFAVEATDADGDPLRYQWTVNRQPAGANKPALDVPVASPETQTVALAISDGTNEKRLEWKLTGRPWEGQPATLKQVALGTTQSFKLAPPSGTLPPGVQIAWLLNEQKVADGSSFLYKATDPNLVGEAPVQLSATARDASGKQVAADKWSFTIGKPPAPKLTASSPASDTVEAAAGTSAKLALTAAPPVNGQSLEYVFDVNGKVTRSTNPSLTVSVPDTGDAVVVASIEDNFKQRSAEKSWRLRAKGGGDFTQQVQDWIKQYLGALNSKNVPTQCALLQLAADKCAQLGAAMQAQGELRVAFSDVQLEPLPDGRVRARYTRVDDFVDPNDKPHRIQTNVTQTFRPAGGKVQLEK